MRINLEHKKFYKNQNKNNRILEERDNRLEEYKLLVYSNSYVCFEDDTYMSWHSFYGLDEEFRGVELSSDSSEQECLSWIVDTMDLEYESDETNPELIFVIPGDLEAMIEFLVH